VRIVGGAWRGRTLVAPPGQGTRPTADRVRQALFDMLMHAEWGGRGVIEGAVVLDVFAGTGALGLEALSRGAASACFVESDGAALKALRANVAACKAEDRTEILAGDALAIGGPHSSNGEERGASFNNPRRGQARPGSVSGKRAGARGLDTQGHDDREWGGATAPASLVFLDPPYGQDLVPRALARLQEAGCLAANCLIVAETGRDEIWRPEQNLMAERQHGAARILIFRTA
jgi:16S rRNA (guanine966-N2)-methyltransferase